MTMGALFSVGEAAGVGALAALALLPLPNASATPAPDDGCDSDEGAGVE
jgi:hypothetical protein